MSPLEGSDVRVAFLGSPTSYAHQVRLSLFSYPWQLIDLKAAQKSFGSDRVQFWPERTIAGTAT